MSRARGPAGMRRQVGFTLIELMIVVAITSVLAVVAINAYRKYGDAGRTAEAMAMIGEFKTKEEAYHAEYNTYLSTTTTGESNLYPLSQVACPAGQQEPCPKTIPVKTSWTAAPLGPATAGSSTWGALGINPTRSQLYCGYVAISGTSGTFPGISGSLGKNLFNNTAPTVPSWYYLVAQCDNNPKNSLNTTFVTAFNSTTVVTTNEHD